MSKPIQKTAFLDDELSKLAPPLHIEEKRRITQCCKCHKDIEVNTVYINGWPETGYKICDKCLEEMSKNISL